MAAQAQAKAPHVDATIAELKQLFGDRVSTAHAVREQHGKDISYHEAHLPDAVVFAESAEEVQQIVQLCARHKTPIIPFGTGTSKGLCSSSVIRPRSVMLLARLAVQRQWPRPGRPQRGGTPSA